jgi:hypothetical protein
MFDEPTEERIFLETLALSVADAGEVTFRDDEARKRAVRLLRSIAIGCDQLALEHKRMGALEEKVDSALCARVETWAEEHPAASEMPAERLALDMRAAQVAATWLLARRTKSAGNMHALGGAAGGIGGLVSLISAFGKTPGDEGAEDKEG